MDLTFSKRIEIGTLIEKTIQRYLAHLNFTVVNTGSMTGNILHHTGNRELSEAFKSDSMKDDTGYIMLRYMPDLFLLSLNANKPVSVFIDVKAMFTPIYLETFHNQLNENYNRRFPLHNVGNVEREALISYQAYTKAGANVAIVAVCTYHPSLILCEYVKNIDVLYTDTVRRNKKSAGSTTPRSNIDLGSMRSFDLFLKEELGVLELDSYKTLISYVRGKLDFIAAPKFLMSTVQNKNRVYSVLDELSLICDYSLKLYEV